MHNHRRYKAYFNQKSVSFQNAVPPERFEGVFLDAPLDLSLNVVLKLFGENENVWVKCRDPKHDFERFCDGFTRVEAAGGLVRDTSGKILMIYRRGRWDLPKGHVEPGESSEDAALREVSEECGIRKLDIAGYITDTWHFYNTFGDWEMKRTHWFSMVCSDCSIPKPQTSEDIEKAVWLEGDALRTAVQDSYRTIQDVFATAAEPRHQNCRHIE